MNIFLSWSGTKSHLVAKAFQKCLPLLFDGLDIYLSTSMKKGVRWGAALDEALEKADFAILCVTRGNRVAPWMMYEAGVLSKTAGVNNVAPFLLDIGRSELQSPVTRFQLTVFEREDLETLVLTINQCHTEEERISEPVLKERFQLVYGGFLEKLLKEALAFQDEDGSEDIARKTLAGVERLLDISKLQLYEQLPDMKKHRQ